MRDKMKDAKRLLRNIASAESNEQYKEKVKELQESETWKDQNSDLFRNWITDTWLPKHEVYWLDEFRGLIIVPSDK